MTRDPGSPPARRTSNRRRAMSRARHTPECEKIWVEFILDHPLCRFHFDILQKKIQERFPLDRSFFLYLDTSPVELRALLKDTDCEDFIYLIEPTKNPHHPYLTKVSEYCTPEVIARCTPTCTKCHRAVHRGKVLCPVCGENYAPWDSYPLMCRPCFDKAHPELVIAQEKHARNFKEKQQQIKKESREKFLTNCAKDTIKATLLRLGRPRHHINQETATVFVWFKNSGKNPLTIKKFTIERMTEEWVRKWRT